MNGLLVWGLLGYLLYRMLYRRPATSSPPGPATAAGREVDDVLVQDPVCQTYIPRQGAESCQVNGMTHYFCGPECRAKFQHQTRSENA